MSSTDVGEPGTQGNQHGGATSDRVLAPSAVSSALSSRVQEWGRPQEASWSAPTAKPGHTPSQAGLSGFWRVTLVSATVSRVTSSFLQI